MRGGPDDPLGRRLPLGTPRPCGAGHRLLLFVRPSVLPGRVGCTGPILYASVQPFRVRYETANGFADLHSVENGLEHSANFLENSPQPIRIPALKERSAPIVVSTLQC